LAINPPSDIVLDVARAADPLKLQAAALRLTGAVDDDGNSFTSLVNGLDPSAASRPNVISAPGLIGLQTDFGPKGSQMERAPTLSSPEMKPDRDFEALVLQTFVQNMLPKDSSGIYGQGTAGEMWKSMLAEQLGKQIARSGGIGIAAEVAKAHPGLGAAAGLGGRAAAGLKSDLALMSSVPMRPGAPAPAAATPSVPASLPPLDINPQGGPGAPPPGGAPQGAGSPAAQPAQSEPPRSATSNS
jgi:hypothetical protein